MESSRAHMILQGLLPAGDDTRNELEQRLVDGRLYELRMLFYLGKDLERWVQQCVDFAGRDYCLRGCELGELSFYAHLVDSPPRQVHDKLQTWGVVDPKAIFTRAIGLRTAFEVPPERRILTDEFIRNYFRYADQIYACRAGAEEYPRLPARQFLFELFASGEYARMLEQQWQPDEALDGTE